MGPSFRYHLSTLIAIFLALGVGMVIGNSYVQDKVVEGLASQQERLDQQFREQVTRYQKENDRYGDWIETIRPLVLKDRLKGRRVALVQTGDYPGLAPLIQDRLKEAGATVASRTVVKPGFPGIADQNLTAILARLRDTHPGIEIDRSAITRVLALAVGKGKADADLDVLASSGLIDREGDYSAPVQCAIVAGGARDESASARVEAVDKPLIRSLKELGVQVVLVEPTDVAVSYVPLVRDLDIATVDNADSDIGQVSAVLAFDSPASDYGVKGARGGIVPRPSLPGQ